MVTDRDLTIAIALAVLLLLIVFCVWPGFLRLRGRDLAGYWASSRGGLFGVQATGARAFTAYSAAEGRAGGGRVSGVLAGLRGVRLGGRSGRVGLGGRRVDWADGEVWSRQGLDPRTAAPGQEPALRG